jgi:hypothetical protein
LGPADFFTVNFYWIDISIGLAIALVIILLYFFKRIQKFTWSLYWVGVLLGLAWELPLSLCNEFSLYPVANFLTPLPFHFSVIVVTHSLWDGGLFLVGVWLIYTICRSPHFSQFRSAELGVLLLWGQLSELAVEISSTFNNAWEYIPYWWNPSLFLFNGHHITLLPQLIWLVAPIVFYLLALKLRSRFAPQAPPLAS